ncbi:MAG: hypothetical protein ABGW78_01245 [Pirellulales bacterium]
MANNPDQLVNLTADPEYASILTTLRGRVDTLMNATGDPRMNDAFDQWL